MRLYNDLDALMVAIQNFALKAQEFLRGTFGDEMVADRVKVTWCALIRRDSKEPYFADLVRTAEPVEGHFSGRIKPLLDSGELHKYEVALIIEGNFLFLCKVTIFPASLKGLPFHTQAIQTGCPMNCASCFYRLNDDEVTFGDCQLGRDGLDAKRRFGIRSGEMPTEIGGLDVGLYCGCWVHPDNHME